MIQNNKCLQEKSIIEIQTYILYNKEAMHRIEKSIEELKENIKEGFAKQEERYAWKWVEKILIFIWATIWSILLGAIMYLIINK